MLPKFSVPRIITTSFGCFNNYSKKWKLQNRLHLGNPLLNHLQSILFLFRNISAEIFVFCSGFLAPDRIDPKLLDPRHVFEELDLEEDAQKASKVDIFHPEKHQRKREGYTEGEISLHKSAHVMDFINSSDPVSMLGNYNEIKWNGDDDSTLKAWPETNHEVLECLKDLKVLGRKDYKRLLKWRMNARKFVFTHSSN